jgi:type IV pilus assembly protein PilM
MASAQGRADGSLFSRFKSGINFSLGSSSSCIGLSIGASSVKIVELKKKKDTWVLEKYAMVALSDQATNNREIINPVSVAHAIQAALKEANISGKNVCAGIIGSSLIIKNLSIVVTDMKELHDQVLWEAEQYIPFDISEVVVDFQVIGKPKGESVDVILVAVKRDFLEQYMSVIEEAKLNPKTMDTEFFALQNVFESNYPVTSTEAMLLVDVGALSTKIVICSGGQPLLVKDTSFGGAMVTQEIQRELKLSTMMDAEALKVSGNLPHEVSEIVARLGHVLGSELKKSIDFYTASSLGAPIAGILLSGGGARAAHLSKVIEDYTGLPTQLLNPFQRISGDAKKFSQDFLMSVAPDIVIPLGLAIRAGEKS